MTDDIDKTDDELIIMGKRSVREAQRQMRETPLVPSTDPQRRALNPASRTPGRAIYDTPAPTVLDERPLIPDPARDDIDAQIRKLHEDFVHALVVCTGDGSHVPIESFTKLVRQQRARVISRYRTNDIEMRVTIENLQPVVVIQPRSRARRERGES